MPTKNTPAVDAFSPQVSLGTQSATARLMSKIGKHKVRVTIKSDSYDFQSQAYVEVWREATLDWSRVASIPYSLMKTPHSLYYSVPLGSKDPSGLTPKFRVDMDDLLNQAREVLL